ncbi:AzlC family ABC transporter permease [Phytohalomonas tamaricis]|uniref:AzlC family ABC transporter permease n=1 Tax=Phytohalomonas tamaricis TaxID=2081032 RepID=UPI000D0B7209|nr:AzlC family ABC transporter permease [Phytohalomonas tamaricis]
MTSVIILPSVRLGLRHSLPIVSGYMPVAVAFGVIATQAGLSPLAATLVSTLMYSGASQFLFIALLANGASPWLAAALALLINLRHIVYGPSLAAELPCHPRLRWLAHGLTDEVFALASAGLTRQPWAQRIDWLTGVALGAWSSWVAGTLIGSLAGEWLTSHWPLLAQVLPFALPALFLVLIAPRFGSKRWSTALTIAAIAGALFAAFDLPNLGLPLAALCGALAYWRLS